MSTTRSGSSEPAPRGLLPAVPSAEKNSPAANCTAHALPPRHSLARRRPGECFARKALVRNIDDRLVAIPIVRVCDVTSVEAIVGGDGRRHADTAAWVVEPALSTHALPSALGRRCDARGKGWGGNEGLEDDAVALGETLQSLQLVRVCVGVEVK